MPASVNIVVSDAGEGGTSFTTGTVTPGGDNRALYAITFGNQGNSYADELRYDDSSGTLVDDIVGADLSVDVFDFTFGFVKTYAQAGSPNTAHELYAHWPGSACVANGITGIYVEGADQTTPFGDEVVGDEFFWDSDPYTVSMLRDDLLPDQIIVGAMLVWSLGGVVGTTYTESAGSDITIIDIGPFITGTGAAEDGRVGQIVAFVGQANGSGECNISIDADWSNGGQLVQGHLVSRSVNDAAGGTDPDPLVAEGGSFTLTGGNAGLYAARRLVAAAGAYTLAGGAAGLLAARRFAAQAGAFSLAGGVAALYANRRLTAQAGSFTLTGVAAGLSAQRRLTMAAGSFALTGNPAGLLAAHRLIAAAGAFSLTGNAAGLRAGRRLVAGAGAFALTGVAADLTHVAPNTSTLTAETGAFVWSGGVATLYKHSRLVAGAGVYALLGGAAVFRYTQYMTAEGGVFSLSGGSAQLRAQRHLLMQAGAFIMAGGQMLFNTGGIIDPSNDRTVYIAEENRYLLLDAEQRTVVYGPDDRTVSVPVP